MEVTTYRTRPSDQPVVEHIARITPDALTMVEDALNSPVEGILTICVTDAAGIAHMGTHAERLAARVPEALWRRPVAHACRPAGPLYGRTAVAPRGLLVLINARPHHGYLGAVTRTLVHEFAHAVQLSRPGARPRRIAQLRAQYGLATPSPQHTSGRDRDETRARALETLADQL